jgi:hypothetical protein
MVWLLLIAILFGFLLKKYTLGHWTTENPNPYHAETLALPRGIFRGILTLSLLFGVIVFELFLMSQDRPENNMGEFMVAFQMMIAFYFGSKVMHHLAATDQKKSHDRNMEAIEVAKAVSPNYPTPAGSIGDSSNDTNYKSDSGSGNTDGGGDDFYDPNSEG